MVYSLIAFDERVTFWLQRIRSLPCACVYVALFAHAYNAANSHAQGSDWARCSQKVTLSSKAIGDVANSKRPLLIIPKVQLRLRVTRRSVTALTRYLQKLAKIVCGYKFHKNFGDCRRSCVHTMNNRGRLEIATSAIGDVANSKRPLLIIPKVQLRLRVTRKSATALARYLQKLAKIVCG